MGEQNEVIKNKLIALEKMVNSAAGVDNKLDVMNKILLLQSSLLLVTNNILRTIINRDSWSEVVCDRKTITTVGTAERLVDERTIAKKIIIVAETDNTGVITIGGTTVRANLADRQGLPLFAGDSFPLMLNNKDDTYNDLREIWLDTTVATDGVTFIYFRDKQDVES